MIIYAKITKYVFYNFLIITVNYPRECYANMVIPDLTVLTKWKIALNEEIFYMDSNVILLIITGTNFINSGFVFMCILYMNKLS